MVDRHLPFKLSARVRQEMGSPIHRRRVGVLTVEAAVRVCMSTRRLWECESFPTSREPGAKEGVLSHVLRLLVFQFAVPDMARFFCDQMRRVWQSLWQHARKVGAHGVEGGRGGG